MTDNFLNEKELHEIGRKAKLEVIDKLIVKIESIIFTDEMSEYNSGKEDMQKTILQLLTKEYKELNND